MMSLTFPLFLLATVVFSQNVINDGNIKDLVWEWCEGNTATIAANHGQIQNWDVSQVTVMSELFKGRISSDDSGVEPNCNPPISMWDVSNVVSMARMVRMAEATQMIYFRNSSNTFFVLPLFHLCVGIVFPYYFIQSASWWMECREGRGHDRNGAYRNNLDKPFCCRTRPNMRFLLPLHQLCVGSFTVLVHSTNLLVRGM